ncbi:epoxide hydrolase 4-like [Elysia marginata]|uniref:Epoxide hydrolase 4-like n=1 Tax=Elysia marginata TaxID=1093978 RepID=A0AAV4EL06_9GAST|nr:epoxide hydrolase 4-like [Elysia marginata]
MVLFSMIKGIFQAGVTKYFSWKKIDRPAILNDFAYGEHGYLHLEDLRIHYVASGPEDKPLMLFLHGFPEFWFSWRHQIKEFQKDYRVVAVDMRGYGDSDKPKGLQSYAFKTLIKDVKQMVAALGYKSCVLMAHDWGGIIAWAVARIYPEVVEKLIILNSPPANVFMNLLHNDQAQKKKSWYIFFFQTPWLPEIFIKSNDFAVLKRIIQEKEGEVSDAYRYVYSQSGALTASINYYRAVFQQVGDKVQHDLNYSMPVLLLWGVEDTAIDLSNPKTIEKANPAITVKYIEEAGHFVHQDAPETVNKLIREWLADVQAHP